MRTQQRRCGSGAAVQRQGHSRETGRGKISSTYFSSVRNSALPTGILCHGLNPNGRLEPRGAPRAVKFHASGTSWPCVSWTREQALEDGGAGGKMAAETQRHGVATAWQRPRQQPQPISGTRSVTSSADRANAAARQRPRTHPRPIIGMGMVASTAGRADAAAWQRPRMHPRSMIGTRLVTSSADRANAAAWHQLRLQPQPIIGTRLATSSGGRDTARRCGSGAAAQRQGHSRRDVKV